MPYGGAGYGEGLYGVETFPTLYKKPVVDIQREYDDPTITSQMENGLKITRPRYEKVRRTYTVNYDHAKGSDATAIDTFYRVTVKGGAGAFGWTDPGIGTVTVVRFAKPPVIRDAGWVHWADGNSGQSYNMTLVLEEV